MRRRSKRRRRTRTRRRRRRRRSGISALDLGSEPHARPSDPPIRGPAQHIKGTPCVSRFLSKTIAYARRLTITFPRFRRIPLFFRSEISASDLGSQPQICDLGCQTLRPTDPGAGSYIKGTPCVSRFLSKTIAYA